MIVANGKYRLDDLTIDLERRRIYRSGQSVSMPALSFNTFRALLDVAPYALTVDELIKRAWNGVVVSNETVTQRIRLLRQALGDDIHQPPYIETVRNEGYRLIPEVLPMEDSASPRVGRNRYCQVNKHRLNVRQNSPISLPLCA